MASKDGYALATILALQEGRVQLRNGNFCPSKGLWVLQRQGRQGGVGHTSLEDEGA